MRNLVFVGSAFVAQYPTGGGNFWVPLQYLLGLRALGVEAHWLELLWAGGDRRRAREFVGEFRGAVERLGVAEWVTLICFPRARATIRPGVRSTTASRRRSCAPVPATRCC